MAMPGVGDSFGRYRIESRLGYGGMGVVFAAHDSVLRRRVALKVIFEHLAAQPGFVARFEREAVVLARLDSPHVITVLDSGTIDGHPFIASQLVPGGDLGALLAARGPLPPGAAATLCAQVARATHAAHAVGIVHRDIKPSNVLIRDPDAPELEAVLCDFGVARDDSSTQVTAAGSVIGTWAYLAPEVAEGEPASVASDVYGLGCLLWAMLTGSAPYGGTDAAILRQHQSAPVPQLPSDDPVAEHLNAVLARAMAKDPADRPASAAELARILLDRDGTPPPAPVARAGSRTRRSLRPALAALLALVALVGVVVWQWPHGSSRDGAGDGSSASADGDTGEVSVSGDFGEPPEVSFDDVVRRTAMRTRRVVDGAGEPVGEGDVVFLQMVVATAGGGEDSNTWTDGAEPGALNPAEFMVVDDTMITAVHEGIVGERVGSRVVVESPVAEAYGDRGRPDLTAAGEDTVVFVVDIVSKALDGPTGRKVPASGALPTVVQRGGRVSRLDFGGVPRPTTSDLVVKELVRGRGPALTGGDSQIALRYLAQVWGRDRPSDENYSLDAPGMSYDAGSGLTLVRPLDLADAIEVWRRGLDGVRVGSRLLLHAPASMVYGSDGAADQGLDPEDQVYFLIDVLGVG